MDLLRYSALKEQTDVISCNSGLPSATAAAGAGASVNQQALCWYTYKERIANYPWDTGNWVGISTAPATVNTAPGAPNSLCVRDGSTWRIGVCCQWTVPAGAGLARFQIWGAGAGSGSGCCCGGSPFGGSGAYASIITPVSAGEQYTLCAGCAACCYCCWTGPYQTCASFVTGPKLSNFCAEGGCLGLVAWQQCHSASRAGAGQRINNNNYACTCGPAVCNGGGDFCSYGCLASGPGGISWVAAPNTFYGCSTAGVAAQGINGMWSCFCTDTNGGLTTRHPPIYGFETLSPCNILCVNCSYASGGAKCFRADSFDFMRYPGAGGGPTNPSGGCNSPNSDTGRFGMVCVTWW